ncbi:SDR family NAD(P)-dependent oxidoreductase [Granulicoccus sp. GXG6511]|uniref:SDR family NAD(P)-dependent oxidoreductase n=1 Tax=Granulicoccus sp. GXG6511 TaxID=3381351 RepID=UPI003D7D8788
MPTALITGATAGIGAEFARQLADRGYDLVLVARDEGRLKEYAEELHHETAVDVEILSADLADRDQTLQVAARLEDQARPIHLLVNNAGFGLRSTMLEPDTTLEERALDVMCRAVMILGGAAARAMKERGRGIIINTSSVAGVMAMGNYSAVKAFVTAYSESLATQLRQTGVTVTALCPGWVRTEFHDRAQINASSIPTWAWIDKTVLVREALADAEKGKVISIPTLGWKVAMTAARLIPRSTARWISAMITSKRH